MEPDRSDSDGRDAPSRVDRDVVINASMQLIPYVGATLAALYFGHKQERRFRRLEEFYEEVRRELEAERTPLADPSAHDPDALRALLEDLHEDVEREHLEVKRAYYRRYFKRTLADPVVGNYEERKLFLDTLGALSVLQLEVLAALARHGGTVRVSAISSTTADLPLVRGGIQRLRTYGLVETELNAVVFSSDKGSLDESVRITPFGRRFNDFCLR